MQVHFLYKSWLLPSVLSKTALRVKNFAMALDKLRIKILKLSSDDGEWLNLAEQRVHLLVALFVRLDAGRTRVGGDQVREEPRRLAIIVHLSIRISYDCYMYLKVLFR